jgi:hypothetical protein
MQWRVAGVSGGCHDRGVHVCTWGVFMPVAKSSGGRVAAPTPLGQRSQFGPAREAQLTPGGNLGAWAHAHETDSKDALC